MNDSVRYAGEAGITSLYHYQDFDPANSVDSDRLVDVLDNNRMFCSDPRSFNDPWDCKPYFDLDALDDPAIMSATAESLIRHGLMALMRSGQTNCFAPTQHF